MTHRNLITRGLAFVAVAGISTLAFAPTAMAAGTVSQAEATALNISIADNAQGTGTVKAINDGAGEQKTGELKPLVGDTLLPDLGVNAGVIYQDAKATSTGTSAACAGLAGDGAAVVELGTGNCLVGGDNLNFELANLSLNPLTTAGPDSPLAGLDALTVQALAPVTAGIQSGIDQVLQAADLNASLEAGAVQAWCTATPDSVDGNGEVTNPLQLVVDVPGDGANFVVNIPITTAPNQKPVSDLDGLTQAVINGIKVQLATMIQNRLSALTTPLSDALQEQVQDQIIANVVTGIQPVLDGLEDNVLDVTINKQTRTDHTIEITALDVQVLPAAKAGLGFNPVSLEIGRVKCGPNNRVAAGEPSDDVDNAGNDAGGEALPAVPTKVTSGVASDLHSARATVLGAAGALLLLAGAGGVMRRRFSQF